MGYGGAPTKAETSNYKDRPVSFVPLKPLPQSENRFDCRSVSKYNLKAKFHSSAEELDFSDAESSSSGSFSDEFIHVHPRLPPKSPTSRIPKPNNHGPIKPFHKIEKVNISTEVLCRFEESLYDSPVSTSRFSDVTHESLVSCKSPLQYPPIQLMERQGGFDPNRIPESVFERSSTPTEWSATSNDSLFSIRLGNNSFSKNHVSATNVDLRRSEERPKSGEFSKSEVFHGSGETSIDQLGDNYESRGIYRPEESCDTSDLKRPDQLIKTTLIHQSVEGVKAKLNMEVAKTLNEGSITEAVDRIKDGPASIMNNQFDEISPNSKNYLRGNHLVDKRESTMQPSAITKKKKSSCPLCYSPNCSHMCHFEWPSCSCKSCLSCASCSRNSCLSCPSCSCKSCFQCPSFSCKSFFQCPSCSCKSCFQRPSCSCKSCLSCPSSSCKSCLGCSSCSCKSCLRWPSCCCRSLRCPSCTCKCFKWPSCSFKCFRKCLCCQNCSCNWLTCTGWCAWNFFSCKSCRFSCPSCCSKCRLWPSCCTCCFSSPTKADSKRRLFCFSCSSCNFCCC